MLMLSSSTNEYHHESFALLLVLCFFKNLYVIYIDAMFLWEIIDSYLRFSSSRKVFWMCSSRKVGMRCCTLFSFAKITEKYLHHCSQQDSRTTYQGKQQKMVLFWCIHSLQTIACELLHFLHRRVGESTTELLWHFIWILSNIIP